MTEKCCIINGKFNGREKIMANTKTRKLYLKDNIVKILLLVIVVWFFGALAVNQMRSNLVQTEEIKTMLLEQVDSGYGLLSGPGNRLCLLPPTAIWCRLCQRAPGCARAMLCLV